MLRVLYVIDHLGGGGAENQFVGLVKRIARKQEVEVRCFLPEGEGVRYEELVAEGVNIITCKKTSEGRSTFRAVRQLRGIIREFKPDVLHCFLMYSAFVAAAASRGDLRPKVFVATEYLSPEKMLQEVRFPRIKRLLLHWSYKQLDALVTESNDLRKELGETSPLPGHAVRVIPAGVDLAACAVGDGRAFRSRLGMPEDKRIVTIVGVLAERKGQMYLLDAFARIADDFKDVHLYIVGEGPLRGELERQTAQKGLETRVTFTGYRRDAKQIIAASDVFCLPSLYEGMPNVVMESMALGTPVITTGLYGALELIEQNESGILVEPADAEGIAQGLRRLLSDREFYDKVIKNAKEKIREFDFSAATNKYIELYRELLG